MDVNLVKSDEHADQRRHLSIKESKVQKLEPWLDRVKKRETCLKELNDESAKIKVLDVQLTSTVVDNLREYLKDYQVHSDDILQMVHDQNMLSPIRQSSRSVFLGQRGSETRRALLATRQ